MKKKQGKVRVLYTMIDGEYENGDSFIMKPNGHDQEEQALHELADLFSWDEEDKRDILNHLRTNGTAMIGNRSIRDVRVENVPTIKIHVRGGTVQDVCNIPDDVQVQVQDYDIQNLTEEELQEHTELDEHGDRCMVSLWEHE